MLDNAEHWVLFHALISTFADIMCTIFGTCLERNNCALFSEKRDIRPKNYVHNAVNQGFSNCDTRTNSGTPATVQWYMGIVRKDQRITKFPSINAVTQKT
jgi:hypothetical protein